MPDITMCLDSKCPSREHCYRFTAKPEEQQCYGEFWRGGKDSCDNFISNGNNHYQKVVDGRDT